MTHASNLTMCSFCGKSHAVVRKLIAGPGVYICDTCINVCKGILDKELSSLMCAQEIRRVLNVFRDLRDYKKITEKVYQLWTKQFVIACQAANFVATMSVEEVKSHLDLLRSLRGEKSITNRTCQSQAKQLIEHMVNMNDSMGLQVLKEHLDQLRLLRDDQIIAEKDFQAGTTRILERIKSLGDVTKDNKSKRPVQPSKVDYEFKCPNPQCQRVMILTPKEFAQKIYECPWCFRKGSTVK